jgi:hypothetical protein
VPVVADLSSRAEAERVGADLARALQAPLVERGLLARILVIGAGLMKLGRFDPERTPSGDDFSWFRTYASTKLAFAAAMRDVARDHPESGGSGPARRGDRQGKRFSGCQEISDPPSSVDRTPRMRSRSCGEISAKPSSP